MTKTMHLRVVTPDRIVIDRPVRSVHVGKASMAVRAAQDHRVAAVHRCGVSTLVARNATGALGARRILALEPWGRRIKWVFDGLRLLLLAGRGPARDHGEQT